MLVYLGRTRTLGVELYARADTNWRVSRSASGFIVFLGGAAISCYCGRQGCIAISTTEAELYALAARMRIELIHIVGLLKFIGYEHNGPIQVETDNKGACTTFAIGTHLRSTRGT